MKYFVLITKTNLIARSMLILAIFSLSLGAGSAYAAPETPAAPGSCGQMLAEAEARFLSTLAPDGSVPANEETRAAAQEYIRVSKLCYEEIEAQNPAGVLQGETPTFIDDGGILMGSESSAEFALDGRKWGSSTPSTPGGTVTYSFMGNGLNLSAEPNSSGYGSSVAISSLPGFQACFITDIQNAFAAWQAVASIQFVQVNDSGSAFNASGATGDIRIGAHTFDGPSGVLAHAYYPPPNGASAAGDMHFDRQENWTCNTSGIDIGVVALHEIGHSLGLDHEHNTLAVMNPYYNPGLAGLQSDDINGAAAIYGGPVALSAPPGNDDFANATTVAGVPSMDTIDTTGAQEPSDNPAASVSCEGRSLRTG
ncbi:MAG TPA: matrixin family metalloprotease, partial [Anaerolineales bacterium]|nr:matrixin family metalloprotease [Anaerolineales bacterium]